MQQKEKQAGGRGSREETREEDEEEPETGRGRDRSRGDGGKRREKEVRSRRAASEGGEQSGKLRWRVHHLEKEKLELTSSHNQEVRNKITFIIIYDYFMKIVIIELSSQLCRLQAELTRLRSSVERGEAQREELQYQLTVSQRDGDRVSELSRDKHTLTGTQIKHTLSELQWFYQEEEF